MLYFGDISDTITRKFYFLIMLPIIIDTHAIIASKWCDDIAAADDMRDV